MVEMWAAIVTAWTLPAVVSLVARLVLLGRNPQELRDLMKDPTTVMPVWLRWVFLLSAVIIWFGPLWPVAWIHEWRLADQRRRSSEE